MSAPIELTPKQRELVRHAIGLNSRNKTKTSYRNHYVTGPGEDFDAWMDLVEKGLAFHKKGSEISGGDDIFWACHDLALAVRNPDEHLEPYFGI